MVAQPVWVVNDELLLGAAMPEWHLDALCREYEKYAEWWFPQKGKVAELRKAQAICRRCSVQKECLAWALDVGADGDYGTWGGTTKDERQKLRRRGITGDLILRFGARVDAGREMLLDEASIFGGLLETGD
ncbi:MAG: WhiB family transcriptional regulator [Actinomycetota bacterium]|nr:WhiB family transcriptional regulator [Actinomycetota bacterium]